MRTTEIWLNHWTSFQPSILHSVLYHLSKYIQNAYEFLGKSDL